MSSSNTTAQSEWMRKSAQVKEENQGSAGAHISNKGQSAGLYSSIVGSLQAQNNDIRTTRGENPFKYAKEDMMQVYSTLVGNGDKAAQVPLDFERCEQVTSSLPVTPAASTDLSSDEKALLSGNINSEQKPRRTDSVEPRLNGRRDRDNRNGARESKKHEARRSTDLNARFNGQIEPGIDHVTTGSADSGRDSFPQVQGRQQSRLAAMGVFDTTVEEPSAWKENSPNEIERDSEKLTEIDSQEVDRLTDIYQAHNLSSTSNHPVHNSVRSTTDQTFNPMSNGLPDLLPKSQVGAAPFPGQPPFLGQVRHGYHAAAPSAALQGRAEQPQMPTRVMVMPDKLKWQYRDPTGQNQGPFSGLEMHDWYKAGFFQPNLLVKREEDEEFEPLSILVRRIGNQREPFLVPLPSRLTSSTSAVKSPDGQESWTNGQKWSSGQSSASSSGGQPPFPQSFPSFGTTLTAEQQNALERRKQEEQYLMHRQREFLQQQQMAQQMAAQRLLHHQNPYTGGHQPFGYGMDRRASPFSSGSERQGSLGSFDANYPTSGQSTGSLGGGVSSGGGPSQNNGGGWNPYNPQLQNPSRGQYTDFGVGIFDIPKSEVTDQLFREPQRRMDSSNLRWSDIDSRPQPRVLERSTAFQHEDDHHSLDSMHGISHSAQKIIHESEPSLGDSSQVDAAPDTTLQPGSAGTIAAFHPKLEVTTKQDNIIGDRRNSKEVNEKASPSSVVVKEGNSISVKAPWAAKPFDKGESLRQIQETEAQHDVQTRLRERKQVEEPQAQIAPSQVHQEKSPGHTLTRAEHPVNELISASSLQPAWKTSASASKKTFAQIQLEEEETTRTAASAAQRSAVKGGIYGPKSQSNAGTRYADTAMKSSNSSWTYVGPQNKTSVSTGLPQIDHKLSNYAPTAASKSNLALKGKLVPGQPPNPDMISLEFLNWARSSLKDLNEGVNFNEFFQLLLSFGTDGGKDTREIISDSIYANSATLDGRRFADEFCRRRKEDLKNKTGQNKSISELTSTLASSSGSNGWSDVVKAKKLETEQDQWNSSFKVQTAKSGKKRK